MYLTNPPCVSLCVTACVKVSGELAYIYISIRPFSGHWNCRKFRASYIRPCFSWKWAAIISIHLHIADYSQHFNSTNLANFFAIFRWKKKVTNLHKLTFLSASSPKETETTSSAISWQLNSLEFVSCNDEKLELGGPNLISSLLKERLTLTLLERNDGITRVF